MSFADVPFLHSGRLTVAAFLYYSVSPFHMFHTSCDDESFHRTLYSNFFFSKY